jgi:hypothetical protein
MSFSDRKVNYKECLSLNNIMTELERQDKIIDVFSRKGANKPCPRCGKNSFAIIEEYITLAIQKDLNNIVIGGPSIPAAVAICNNCGYISLHALGAIGLLEKVNTKGDGKK